MTLPFDADRQVSRLHPHLDAGTVAEIRGFGLPERKGAPCVFRSFYSDHARLTSAALKAAETAAMYVGVGARRCPDNPDDFKKCRHSSKGKDHIAYLNAAWCELDVGKHGHESIDAIVQKLDAQPVPPSMMIGSGGGVHAYWLFDEPVTDLDRVKTINRALCKRLGADSAFDPSRILRLAGTWHRKREPVRVRVLRTPPVRPELLEVRCCDASA